MTPAATRYDVLELKYADGAPAVLRHVDGSGFAYYPSGRKAVCVSSHGTSGTGKARRFSAVIHADKPRSPVVGCFDEWGRGYADGELNIGDRQAPKVQITDRALMVIDGSGKLSEVPCSPQAAGTGGGASGGGSGRDSAQVNLRLNGMLTLQHRLGRTTLEFQAAGVSHAFALGELQGDEVHGMQRAEPRGLTDETMRQLGEATQKLDSIRSQLSTLKVDPSQRNTKPSFKVDTACLKDVLDKLPTLNQSLAHPDLAPHDLTWKTEGKLRKLIAAAHPQCPGVACRKSWSIAKVGGKCTEERLMNAKPTATTPKSIALVSQLRLPEMVDEHAAKKALLVVICLANYALEQSNYAKLVAEKAHAELWARFCDGPDGGPPPVRLVAVELTESTGFAEAYGIKEVPYCLMFHGGNLVYSKRLCGMRLPQNFRKPRVLLVEPDPALQLKLERNLRRNGYSSDLAMDGPQALRLASQQQAYGVLLVSSLLRADQLRAAASAARRSERDAIVLTFNVGLPSDEDPEARKRFVDECTFAFQYVPSWTALAAVLARFDTSTCGTRSSGAAGFRGPAGQASQKQDFLDDVLGILDKGGGGPRPFAHAVALPAPAHSHGPAATGGAVTVK